MPTDRNAPKANQDSAEVFTGARVRRLPRVLDSREATRLLEVVGFEAADKYLAKQHPEEQELYALLERTRARLAATSVTELLELSRSKERQEIFENLRTELSGVLEAMSRVRREA